MAGRSNMFKPPKAAPIPGYPPHPDCPPVPGTGHGPGPGPPGTDGDPQHAEPHGGPGTDPGHLPRLLPQIHHQQVPTYCFITCRGPHHRAELAPDPTGTLRLAFEYSPTLLDLQDELDWRFPLPTHLFDAA